MTGRIVASLAFLGILLGGVRSNAEPIPAAPKPERTERRVYVPLDELDVIVERDQEGVFLSREEHARFSALAKSYAAALPPSTEPVLVVKADYGAEVLDEQLVLTVVMEFNQLKPGWHALPLPFRNLALERAALDDKPARLGRDGSGHGLVLLTSQPGKHVLALKLSTNLARVGSDRVAAFGLAPATAATLRLTLPEKQFLAIDDHLLDRPGTADQPAEYTIAVGGRTDLTLRITGRPADVQTGSLLFASTAIGIHVAPEERTWRAVTTLDVFGKPIDALEVLVPQSLEIVSNESAGLERWEKKAGPAEGTSVLRLAYRQPFADRRSVVLQGIAAGGAGEPWNVPTLRLPGVAAHRVHVAVQHPPEIRLQPVEAIGVRRIIGADTTPDQAVISAGETTVHTRHYAAWREDFSLRFLTRPRVRELLATIATRVDIGSHELQLRSSVAVETRFAPLFDLDLAVPAEWAVTDVVMGDRPARWRVVPVDAGSNRVQVSLQPPIAIGGRLALTLTARRIPGENWPIEEQPLLLALPELSLPDAGVTDGRYMVAADDDLELAVEEMTGLDPARLSDAEQRLASAPRLVYEYQDTHFRGTLRVTRRPLQLAAETLACHRLDREALVSHLEARVLAEGGGVRKLELALPEAAGTDLRFRLLDASQETGTPPPEVIEQTFAAPVAGMRVWTLRFDRRVFGLLWLLVDLHQQRAADTKEFTLPALEIRGAALQGGQIAVEGDADQQLRITATDAAGGLLPEVEPADVPSPSHYEVRERIVAAFRVSRPGSRVTLQETRFESQGVPSVIGDRASLVSVLGAAGELQHKAEFDLRGSGVQSLRVDLPDNADLWAAKVDGRPIEVRLAPGTDLKQPAYLVPLPAGKQPDRTEHLELFYSTSVGPLSATGTLRQEPPRLAAVTGEGEPKPIEMLQYEWTLFHPAGTSIVASNGQFEVRTKLTREGLLGALQQSIHLDSFEGLARKGFAVAALVAVVGAFWLSFRRRGAAGLATTMIVGLALLMLAVLILPATQSAREAAERPANWKPAGDVRDTSVERFGAADFVSARSPGSLGGASPELIAQQNAAATLGSAQSQPADKSSGDGVSDGKKSDPGFARRIAAEPDRGSPAAGKETPPVEADARAPLNGKPEVPEGHFAGEAPRAGPIPPAADADAPGAEQPARDELSRASLAARSGGRLSLAIQLEPDSDSRQLQFSYAGSPAPGIEPVLEIEYQNRHANRAMGWAWQAGVLLLFWLARHWSAGPRAGLAVLGFIVPLALAPLAPPDALTLLDALFLGTIWGLVLWGVLEYVAWRRRSGVPVHRDRGAKCSVGWLLLVMGTALTCAGTLSAGDAQSLPEKKSVRQPARNVPPRSVVVPYDPAGDPLQFERVFLPFDQFLELWTAAHPEARVNNGAPCDGVVSEALYAAELVPAAGGGRAHVAVKGRIVLHSFRSEQVSLPLPLAAIALSAATLDGKAASLITRGADEQTELAVVLPERGAHVLDLAFSVPAELSGPSGKVLLPLKPVPSGALRLTFPEANLTLKVSGKTGMFRRVREGDRTVAIVPIDQDGDLALAWSPERSRNATEGIVHVDSSTAVALGDSGLRINAGYKFTVRQGTLSEPTFAFPAGLFVRRIRGLDVSGWEIAGEGDQRTLKVFLRRPVDDVSTIEFELFQPQAIGDESVSFAVPQFAARGVTRETGTVGIDADSHLALAVGTATGLAKIDAARFAASSIESAFTAPEESTARSAPRLAFHFAARPFQLQLVASRRKPATKGLSGHACFIGQRKMRIASRIELQFTGAPRSEVVLQLPPGYLLNDLKSRETVDYSIERSGDGKPVLLRIDLASPRMGTVELLLEGMIPRLPTESALDVALPVPAGVGEWQSTLAVWLDRAYSATIENSEGWKAIDPAQLPARLRQARRSPVQLAFTSNRGMPQPIRLGMQRVAGRLSASALSVVMARDVSVDYSLYLRWRIALAGDETLIFTTPDWLADRLVVDRRLPGVRVRQVTSEKIPGNKLRWTVSLDEPPESELLLSARAVLPLPELPRIAAPVVTFERLVIDEKGRRFQPLESQQQHLVLINASARQLERDAPAGTVEAVSPAELPIRIGSEISDQAAEILAVHGAGGDVGWKILPFSALKALPAAVNLSRSTLVVARDGSWRQQSGYRVNNRSRQFLSLRLPQKSRVLSLFVAGEPARPINPRRPNDPDVVLVPLPKTAAGDLSAEIRLVLAGQFDHPLPKGVQVLRTEFDLPAVQVLSQAEDPEFGAPVAATEWTVVLPEDIDATAIDDPERTNVAPASEGIEQLIAQYQECLNLLSVAVEGKLRKNYQQASRAERNFRELARTVDANNFAMNRRGVDERQSRRPTELQQKLNLAQQEWANQSQDPKNTDSGQFIIHVSPQRIQQAILANNSLDTGMGDASGGTDELKLELADSHPARPPQGNKAGASVENAGQLPRSRAALKGETAAQSIDVNQGAFREKAALRPEGRNEEVAGGAKESPSQFDQPGSTTAEGSADASTEDRLRFDNTRRGRRSVLDRADRSPTGAMAGVPIVGNRPDANRRVAQNPQFGGAVEDNGGAAGVKNDAMDGAGGRVRSGGLSLEIGIPEAGRKLTFSKPGGGARLALGLRPGTSMETGLGLIWIVIWGLIALGLAAALGRSDALAVLWRRAAVGILMIGLAWYFLLPGAILGFGLFAIGLITLAWQHRRAA
jgi:hypothetical protein